MFFLSLLSIQETKTDLSKKFQAFLRLLALKSRQHVFSLHEIRRIVSYSANVFPPLDKNVRVNYVEITPECKSYWIQPVNAYQQSVLLYIHGGAFISNSAKNYNAVAYRFGKAWGMNVLNVDYRLAPEHPMPAALMDVVHAYKWLLKHSDKIVVAGDSAGGGLALLLMQWIVAQNKVDDKNTIPIPICAALFSPYTDLTHRNASIKRNNDCDLLLGSDNIDEMLQQIQNWVCPNLTAENPLCSPYFGSFSNLPPLYFVVSDNEILFDDTIKSAKKAINAGVTVHVDVGHRLCHAYPIFSGIFPEAEPNRFNPLTKFQHNLYVKK